MATASCINSRRDEEAVRGVDRSSPSERRQPPRGPDLSCSRTFGGRLDGHRATRVAGKLV